jgi:hypothetical protein
LETTDSGLVQLALAKKESLGISAIIVEALRAYLKRKTR